MHTDNKKKTVLFIGWYLPSLYGGAEKSMIEVLKSYKQEGYDIFAISLDDSYPTGEYVVDTIQGKNYSLAYNVVWFSRYMTAYMNRAHVSALLDKERERISQATIILTQGILSAPIIAHIHKWNSHIHYYLRDEGYLNEFHNYETGFRWLLKSIKDVIELPFLLEYKKENMAALGCAEKRIANSVFMQQALKKKFDVEAQVSLPKVDFSQLDAKRLTESKKRFIGFIGAGNAMKGSNFAHTIAHLMPQEQFLFVYHGKHIMKKNNITYIPYSKDVMRFYEQCRLILMPSRWMEAYGRVVAEAEYLGIPVLYTKIGGLTEASKYEERAIPVQASPCDWVKYIHQILADINEQRKMKKVK